MTMKTKLFFSAMLFAFTNANAQNFSSNEKKNIVKTNLAGLVLRNYNLSYERAIMKWFSMNVSYGNLPMGKLPLSKMLFDGDADNEITDIQISNTQFTLEPRFYLSGSKGFGEGFYIAPYYRYTKMSLEGAKYEFYSESTEEELPLTISGKATANSFGLMIGNQWILGKNDNWVIDFWIAGGHYGSSKGDFDGVSSRILTNQEQMELEEHLNELDIPVLKYTIQTNDRGAKISLKGPWAGLRSGLAFGYRF